ncbi:MAG: clindamycin resistance transfer factor BtgB [Bacteroides clarus]|uniref:DUF5712 family protein n=1 Tax=Bacteroides clarus TaxID=626929 RepID=UPI00241FAE1F|nr:DUF5712 family protein [Bacteroides clarus]MBD9145449.1 clindamycin resistance transfer factor BtgB [Bacteroides clarus]
MHIDFAPPSNGTYNNSGSSRKLANYMEHEDLERMEKGIYAEGFFNLTDDNIYKSKVIKDIDSNIGQLLKTDAKFYAIHISPSEKELRVMGNTEQEQAEAMKRYIREVFIPEYAKNFNKGLSKADIKFYGKIHFSRDRSNNELNMHCHLIVSRKDQANKKKLSPLTNHKNTKNGVIKGGFDRVNLFRQAEHGFDKLFGYDRQQSESFDYHNTMKNGSISKQIELQNQTFTDEKKKDIFESSEKENMISCNLDSKVDKKHSYNQQNNRGCDSLLSIFSLGGGNNSDATLAEDLQAQKHKKKKKKGHRL